jgi:hypothetical protein
MTATMQNELDMLIEKSKTCLLNIQDQAKMTKYFWLKSGKTIDQLKKMINRAYFLNKSIQSGNYTSKMIDELNILENDLPTTDFKVLYKAITI